MEKRGEQKRREMSGERREKNNKGRDVEEKIIARAERNRRRYGNERTRIKKIRE